MCFDRPAQSRCQTGRYNFFDVLAGLSNEFSCKFQGYPEHLAAAN